MTALSGLRGRLHSPGALFFAHMAIPEPAVATILGYSGVDFVMVDAEHGPFTLSSMRACVAAVQATRANVVVRTASSDRVEIRQLLDLGADGVIVPHIESAEQARAVVAASRYPPDGTRGVGSARANRYGLDLAACLEGANSSVAVMVIIESRRGVDNAAGIASVPGLDGILVGPTDLAADLGLGVQPGHPSVLEAIEAVVTSAMEVGVKVSAWRDPRSAAERESFLVGCASDVSTLTKAMAAAVERERHRFEATPREPRH